MYKVYKIRTEDGKVYVGCTRMMMNRRMNAHRHLKKPFVLEKHTLEIMFETDSRYEAHKLEAFLIAKYDSTNQEKGYNRRFGGSEYGFPKYVKDAWSEKVISEGTFSGKNNSNYGKHHSDETKEKIRLAALKRDPSTFEKNRIKTTEQLRKLQEGRIKYFEKNGSPAKGRKLSEEQKKKISERMKGHKQWLGKKHSPESIQKMRESHRKRRLLKSFPI